MNPVAIPVVVARKRSGRYCALVLALCSLRGTAAAETESETASTVASYKKLTLAQLMDLEVTSVSRRPELLAQAPSAIQVITADEIRRAGAMRLPDALRLASNLEVAQIDSHQWAIAARGFNNTTTNKLLVQQDGRTLYTPLFAGVFWDVQDTLLEDVDRIEVISGPGATQWGSNAVNGVINITTKNARDTQGGLLSGAAGTELRAAGAARYGGTLAPGVFYRVYGKYTEADSSLTPTGAAAGDAWRMTQGGFRTDWERADADHFTFQGDTYQGRFDQPGNTELKASGSNLLGRWSRTLAPKNELSLQMYYDYTYRAIPASITEHLSVYDVDLQQQMPLGDRQSLVWGAGYRAMDDRVRNPSTFGFLPANVRRNWYSGFLQDAIDLWDQRLRLTAGLKVEHNPYTGVEYQPSLRAGWKLQERQLLWAAVSRAVRTPSRIDRELFAPLTAPYVIAGGPTFSAENLTAYEVGYRTEPRTGLAVSVATFFHDYNNLRSLEPVAGSPGTSRIANGIQGKSYGVELNADYRLIDWWRLRFGYTEQRVTSHNKRGSVDRTSVRTQVLDPNRHFVLQSQFDLPAHMAVDVTTRYVGRIANQLVPPYLEADLRWSWQPTDRWEFALTGRNLLDASHPEFGDPATRREIERSVNISSTWRF
jgi:iron complex outermembrane recepter protein